MATRVRLFSLLTLGFAVVLFAVPGYGNVLPPGPSSVAPDVFANNGGAGYGAILANTGVQAFNFAGDTGSVQQIVTTDPVTGFLDFLTEVNVTGGELEHVTVANFSGAGFGSVSYPDVGYDTIACLTGIGCAAPGPNVIAPTTVNTLNNVAISFNFAAGVMPGQESELLVVKTDARTFGAGTIGLIDGGGATLGGYAPSPEPSQVGLLLGGLFAAGLFLTRRFQTRQS
jgi:hypothetical protein